MGDKGALLNNNDINVHIISLEEYFIQSTTNDHKIRTCSATTPTPSGQINDLTRLENVAWLSLHFRLDPLCFRNGSFGSFQNP